MPPPEPARFLAALEAESGALAGAARTRPEAPVATCPGWVVTDVVRHVGAVHRRAAVMVRERSASELAFSVGGPAPSDPVALLAWFEEGAGTLAAALRAAGSAAPVWNWTDAAHTAGFRFRRMAHETSVHRWDVAGAVGGPVAPIGTDLALDGIEELFELFLPEALVGLPAGGLGGSLRLSCTDAPGEWGAQAADRGGADHPGSRPGDGHGHRHRVGGVLVRLEPPGTRRPPRGGGPEGGPGVVGAAPVVTCAVTGAYQRHGGYSPAGPASAPRAASPSRRRWKYTKPAQGCQRAVARRTAS